MSYILNVKNNKFRRVSSNFAATTTSAVIKMNV